MREQQHNLLLLIHDAIDLALELDVTGAKQEFRRVLERITDLQKMIQHEQRHDKQQWSELEAQREELEALETLITRYVNEEDVEAQELWIKAISEHVTELELRNRH